MSEKIEPIFAFGNTVVMATRMDSYMGCHRVAVPEHDPDAEQFSVFDGDRWVADFTSLAHATGFVTEVYFLLGKDA